MRAYYMQKGSSIARRLLLLILCAAMSNNLSAMEADESKDESIRRLSRLPEDKIENQIKEISEKTKVILDGMYKEQPNVLLEQITSLLENIAHVSYSVRDGTADLKARVNAVLKSLVKAVDTIVGKVGLMQNSELTKKLANFYKAQRDRSKVEDLDERINEELIVLLINIVFLGGQWIYGQQADELNAPRLSSICQRLSNGALYIGAYETMATLQREADIYRDLAVYIKKHSNSIRRKKPEETRVQYSSSIRDEMVRRSIDENSQRLDETYTSEWLYTHGFSGLFIVPRLMSFYLTQRYPFVQEGISKGWCNQS
jgi:hypothetical protein